MTRPARILVVDDDPTVLRCVDFLLAAQGHAVTSVPDPHAALELHRTTTPAFDLVITDYHMPRLNGLDLVRAMRRVRPEGRFVMISAQPPALPPAALRAAGLSGLLVKPFAPAELEGLVRAALEPAGHRPRPVAQSG